MIIFHFFLECKEIIQVREQALTPLKANIPDRDVNFDNPIDALKSFENDSNIVHFGKFVEKIYGERERLIHNSKGYLTMVVCSKWTAKSIHAQI